MNNFNTWFSVCQYPEESKNVRTIAGAAWNHQQAKIDSKQTRINALHESLNQIIKVLGPSAPDCGCQGCQIETDAALSIAREAINQIKSDL